MKIINIIHFPFNYHLLENEEPSVKWETGNGNWCGIWQGNWSQRLGNAILESEYEIKYEVWRPDLRADKVYSHTFENGLKYRLFPAKYYKYLWGIKFRKVAFSKLMIDHIDKQIKQEQHIILHINAGFRYHDKIILDKFYNKVSIVAQSYTNLQSSLTKEKTKNLIKYIHRRLIWSVYDDYYKKLKYIIPSTQKGLETIANKYNLKIFYRDNLANFGIDFSVWNSIISKGSARKILNIDESEFVFFHSSRLIPCKQIDFMIKEFSKIKNKSFIVYLSGKGEKGYEKYLENIVRKNNIQNRIKFIGYVTDEKLKNYYIACDAFLSCSKSEAGPFSTALAAHYEKPIITTNTGIVYDLLQNHNSGFIINKDDCSQWHKTIARVLNGNKIPVCPKEIVDDFFNWDKISNYYINTYKKVLKNRT